MADEPAPKRQRTALACVPTCSSCEAMAFDCHYVQSTTSSNLIINKEYVATWEARLQQLEQAFLQRPGRKPTGRDHEQDSGTQFPSPASPLGTASAFEASPIQVQDVLDDGSPIDAMGAVIFADEPESGFFGASSNITLLRHISQAATALSGSIAFQSPDNPAATGQPGDGHFLHVSRPLEANPGAARAAQQQPGRSGQQQPRVDLYAMPSEPAASRLLAQFFSYPGYLFPYIHEDAFMETYTRIRDSATRVIRRTWLGLFNIVLAMAVSTHVTPEVGAAQRCRDSDVYYQRAVGLCGRQILRGTNLEVVHYLLLLGQYLQGTQKSVEAWVVHGLAVKAAMQLGLHSSDCSRAFPPLEQEIRKRTWFGCVLLDRTLSMTMGRPAAIPASYIQLDLPRHLPWEPVADHPRSREARNPVNVRFYTATITLYGILGKIIDGLYGQNVGCGAPLGPGETVREVVALDEALHAWEDALPADLRLVSHGDLDSSMPTAGEDVPSVLMLRTILTLRYLNIRLLLFRPLLVPMLERCSSHPHNVRSEDGTRPAGDRTSWLRPMGSHAVQQSVTAAADLVATVHTIVSSRRALMGAWWYTLYFVFNAGLTIFGCFVVCRDPPASATTTLGAFTAEDALHRLSQVSDALMLLDRDNGMAARCRHYIHLLTRVLQMQNTAGSTSPEAPAIRLPFAGGDFNLEDPLFDMNVGDFFGQAF